MKLKYDEPPSEFAFCFHSQRYHPGALAEGDESGGMVGESGTKYKPRARKYVSTPSARPLRAAGRGLHSSTFRLNLHRFCHTSPRSPV
jgi:hypothetical protein